MLEQSKAKQGLCVCVCVSVVYKISDRVARTVSRRQEVKDMIQISSPEAPRFPRPRQPQGQEQLSPTPGQSLSLWDFSATVGSCPLRFSHSQSHQRGGPGGANSQHHNMPGKGAALRVEAPSLPRHPEQSQARTAFGRDESFACSSSWQLVQRPGSHSSTHGNAS